MRCVAPVGAEAREDAAAMLPDDAAAARHGVLMACLGILLSSSHQALPEDALFSALEELGLRKCREQSGALVRTLESLSRDEWRGAGAGVRCLHCRGK